MIDWLLTCQMHVFMPCQPRIVMDLTASHCNLTSSFWQLDEQKHSVQMISVVSSKNNSLDQGVIHDKANRDDALVHAEGHSSCAL